MSHPLRKEDRRGAVAVMAALLLTVILGMVACALDIGWILMTRTQLQAASDSSSLAGGTELLPGLGLNATKTPEEVREDAIVVAVDFARRNPNGEKNLTFLHAGRDVKFGKAVFDPDCGCWDKIEGEEPHNYVEVTAHRDQDNEGGDGRLPLFFARIFGIDTTEVMATATAAILPAKGFRIEAGSDDRANVMPFAFSKEIWDRFLDAQKVFDDPSSLDASIPYSARDTNMLTDELIKVNGYNGTGDPLFGLYDSMGTYNQLMFDDFTVSEGSVSSGADRHLEINVYPHDDLLMNGENQEGSFGTVDFGDTNNSTNDLKRQIEEGLNADDLSYYEDSTLSFTPEDPLDAESDTGISGGIEDSLESVIGECKAIALFTSVSDEGGNNAIFTLVEFVAVTVVEVELGGNNKRLLVQPCTLVDDNAVADTDEEIGEEDSIFTPLILIR